MARIIQPYEITGPFAGVIFDNLFAYGNVNDQGSIVTGATVTTQVTPKNIGTPDVYGLVFVNNAGNITGVIVQAGRYVGQLLTVVNYGSGTIAFAAVGTSNVLQGATGTVAVNQGVSLIWVSTANVNSGTAVWVVT